ncbi:DUF2625 domain-containing protein [Mucilaginibacter agri]|uniref:DUF2625 family protein n=1 Tax=Mucilaginibacter agri TaxID=2695265 RepID=A0A965ZFW8_9SPHI|nr:DUF2625 domain-containing protein [Mucilaginibacter agri]NCD68931.1 DUF2625 family protein [Mucilaginibacter agri]
MKTLNLSHKITLIAVLLILSQLPLLAQLKTRNLAELTADKSGWDLVKDWAVSSKNKVEFLPVNKIKADTALHQLQITTRSPMGAIVYFTGGVIIDNGWLRILGSGSDKLNRSIPSWNKGKTFSNFGEQPKLLLVADDVVGGLFAINGGALGNDFGKMYYFAPESLYWEPLNFTYSDFLDFCFNGNIAKFYATLRWKGWEKDIQGVDGNQAFSIYPFLWTKEGKDLNKVSKKAVPVEEVYSLNQDNLKAISHN